MLERDAEREALRRAAHAVCQGTGSVALIGGEAGIGKSSLVAALPGILPGDCRLLVSWCDDLGTPRVLGPLRDLGAALGSAMAEAAATGDRDGVLAALVEDLSRPGRRTVLVVEDVHWADEATLDVLSFLVRRVERLAVLLVLTYRDDALPSDHPLRPLLGLAARTVGTVRVNPGRLSRDAVRQLSAGSGLDPDRVFEVTDGNPYFVTELVAGRDAEGVPLTVADAIQARLTGLDPVVRACVEQLAVVPSAVEFWLVEATIAGGVAALAGDEVNGLLRVGPDSVTFRHELARRAIVDHLPGARRVAANRAVLAALLDRPTVDVSRIVHHARQCGDDRAVLAYGPLAADEAIGAGAHRQAVAHLRAVLDLAPLPDPQVEATLWHRYAVESYTIDAPCAQAMAAQREAVRLGRAGQPGPLGESLRWLSRIAWWAGDPATAARAGAEAVAVLQAEGDGDALAMALSNQRNCTRLPAATKRPCSWRTGGCGSPAGNGNGSSPWPPWRWTGHRRSGAPR